MTEASDPATFKAACIQLRSSRDVGRNVETVIELVGKAADEGADFILTPENTSLMEAERSLRLEKTTDEEHDKMLAALRELAGAKKIWLLIGSLAIRIGGDKLANRSFLITPEGRIAARYDKIHMFDVDLPTGESHRESRHFEPGRDAVLADLPWGRLGLSICYDLRFPHLYRTLAHSGASFLTVPSAFTVPTGRAHWHVLLRARAIETGCYVFAPAQGGQHENGRETYGHSLIVAPWGDILAEAETEPGFIMADIDTARIARARSAVPSLGHDRLFSVRSAS